MKVSKNKFGMWVTKCHNKLLNGEDIWCDLSVRFQKGREPENSPSEIEMTKYWFSAYMSKNNDKDVRPVLFIQDYVVQSSTKEGFTGTVTPDEIREQKEAEQMTLSPKEMDNLPFY